MAVLKGEGRVPILFGSLPLPIPPNRSAYIARPDVAGTWATVVVAPDASGVTPSVKAFARHLARHGYAAFVPTLRPGHDDATADVAAAVRSARIPGTEWADGDRLAVVGIGVGGIAATITAIEEDADVLVLVGASLDRDLLAELPSRLLVVHGADDDSAPAAEAKAMREELGTGEWVLYSGVGSGFFDDGSDRHDPAAASDAIDRIVAALDARFGAVPAR